MAVLITVAVLAVGAYFGWRFINNEILPQVEEATEAFTLLSDSPPGPCYDLETEEGAVTDWTDVSCDGAHQVEVSFAAPFEEGPFPGDEYLANTAAATCRDAFETYVGISQEDSIYAADWLVPTESMWDGGVRNGICVIVTDDGSPLNGAAKDSSR